MPVGTSIGTLVTTVDDEALYPLGFRYVEPAQPEGGSREHRGERHWVYVVNDEAATAFAQGDVICRDPSAATYNEYGGLIAPITTAEPAHNILGVANHAIAAGSYGFIICKGFATVKCGTGNITADAEITSGGTTAGKAKTMGAGDEHCVFGVSLEGETTDDTTFDAYINCPGA
jgi:anaerobic selenocysteine-containing dehydrogenase